MKLSKCHFFAKIIQYPGHILTTTCIKPLPSKTQAINNMYPPKTAKQVHAFLGLVAYYRIFSKNFARIAKPLTLLTHHKAKLEWTPAHHMVFMTQKEAVIQTPISHYPDPAKKYIVYTDASHVECYYHRNTMEPNSQLLSYLTPLLKHKGNGVPQNRKPMKYIML